MKFGNRLGSIMIGAALLTSQISNAQDTTTAKVERICDENGDYINPPNNRDMELETDICWMEANLAKREALVKTPEFNKVQKFTTLNGEPDEEFDSFIIASRKRIKESLTTHKNTLKYINDSYRDEGADGFSQNK